MEKGDLSEKSEACMQDHTWLRLRCEKSPTCTLPPAYCNAYAMVRQQKNA
jgi:hypothetical protein